MQTTNIAFDTAGIISLLVGFVLPALVGYFTKASMNSGLKAAILAATAGVSGVLSQWLNAINNHQHFVWQAAVLSALATWLVSEGAYLKFWKPSGASDVLQAAGPIADAPAATDAVTPAQLEAAIPTVENLLRQLLHAIGVPIAMDTTSTARHAADPAPPPGPRDAPSTPSPTGQETPQVVGQATP